MPGKIHKPVGLSKAITDLVPLIRISQWPGSPGLPHVYTDGDTLVNEGSVDVTITIRGSGATANGAAITLPSGVYLEVSPSAQFLRNSTEAYTVMARTKTQFNNSRAWWWNTTNLSSDTSNLNEVGTLNTFMLLRGASGLLQNKFSNGNDLHIAFNHFAWRYTGSGDVNGFSCWKNGVSLPSSTSSDTLTLDMDKTAVNPIAKIGKRRTDQNTGWFEIETWEFWDFSLTDDYIIERHGA